MDCWKNATPRAAGTAIRYAKLRACAIVLVFDASLESVCGGEDKLEAAGGEELCWGDQV